MPRVSLDYTVHCIANATAQCSYVRRCPHREVRKTHRVQICLVQNLMLCMYLGAYAYFCFPCFMCTLATELNECALGPFCFDRMFVIAMRTKVRTMYGIRVSKLLTSLKYVLRTISCLKQRQNETYVQEKTPFHFYDKFSKSDRFSYFSLLNSEMICRGSWN